MPVNRCVSLSLSQQTHKGTINDLVHGYFPFQSSAFKLLFDHRGNRFFRDPAVYRKGVAVLIVARRRIGRVHLDVLFDRLDGLFFVFQGISHTSLVRTQELYSLFFLLCQPRLARRKSLVRPFGKDPLQIEKFQIPLSLRDFGDREPDDARIDRSGRERREAGGRAADLKNGHFLRVDAEMLQRRSRQIVRQGAEPADGESLALRLLHRFEAWIRVELERHEITNPPKILDVRAGRPTSNGLDKRAAHNLNVAADQGLKIGRAGVEHYKNNVQPRIFEETLFLRHIDRQERDVHRRKSHDNFGLAPYWVNEKPQN